jgi:hypothetical protein
MFVSNLCAVIAQTAANTRRYPPDLILLQALETVFRAYVAIRCAIYGLHARVYFALKGDTSDI